MKGIGIALLLLGLLGLLMACAMFGDIGIACGVAALCSLITGAGFWRLDKKLKNMKSE